MRQTWDFYGHFLMPIFMFFIFMGGQYLDWSPNWSKLAKFSFGVYLVHPVVIDLIDIALYGSGLSGLMTPWQIVVLRYAFALPGSFLVALGLSNLRPLAWTIGLGPTPWEMRKTKQAAGE